MSRVLRPATQVLAYLRNSAPEPRRTIKRALEGLRNERGDIKALERNLEGYYRLKVGKHRVLLNYAADGAIEVVFIEERSLIYEVFEAEFIKKLKQ